MSSPYQEYRREGLLLGTDPSLIDIDAVHEYLCHHSYWAAGIPKETLRRAIEHSLCFGLYDETRQIGLARVITDRATYAYLCDVYVLEEYRGRGISKWMMQCVIGHPDLQGLRRFMLATRDAHELYRRFGFDSLGQPERLMEIRDPDPYGIE